MASSHFPVPESPTPAWLTAVLQDADILPSGAVSGVEVIPTGAFNSRTAFMRLHYTAAAPPSAPTRLVLKRNTPLPASGVDACTGP